MSERFLSGKTDGSDEVYETILLVGHHFQRLASVCESASKDRQGGDDELESEVAFVLCPRFIFGLSLSSSFLTLLI